MYRVIVVFMVNLLFYTQPIWAESLDKNKVQFTSLRVDRGKEIKYIYMGIEFIKYMLLIAEK